MKTLYACLLMITIFTLSSCGKEAGDDQLANSFQDQKLEGKSKRDYFIYITSADLATGKLELSDKGSTGISNAPDVDYDQVHWIVSDKVANIQEISGFKHVGGKSIFEINPEKTTPGTRQKSVWSALYKVGSSEVGDFQEYCIEWIDAQGKKYSHDPRMVVNP